MPCLELHAGTTTGYISIIFSNPSPAWKAQGIDLMLQIKKLRQ